LIFKTKYQEDMSKGNGWKEFSARVIQLERNSLGVSKIRKLKNRELYRYAAKQIAILYPEPFQNEYELIASEREKRENATGDDEYICSICLDRFAFEIVCRNAHTVCQDCVILLYDRAIRCPLCRSQLLHGRASSMMLG